MKISIRIDAVSTHSRLKAAGRINLIDIGSGQSFNTQPPEGGWPSICLYAMLLHLFQHTAA